MGADLVEKGRRDAFWICIAIPPETYTAAFVIDVRGGWVGGGGVYRLYGKRSGWSPQNETISRRSDDEDWAEKGRIVANVHEVGKDAHLLGDQQTWKVDSEKGYWALAIHPVLERGRDRDDSQVALSLNMDRRGKDNRRSGATGEVTAEVSGTPKPPATSPKYTAGRRLFKAGWMHAMDNTPATSQGMMI